MTGMLQHDVVTVAEILNGGCSKVSCIIRAQDTTSARVRVETTLQRCGLTSSAPDLRYHDLGRNLEMMSFSSYIQLLRAKDRYTSCCNGHVQ